MKKIFLTLSLAIAAAIAIPTVANAQDAQPTQQKECCKEKKNCPKEGKECKKDCRAASKACVKEGKDCKSVCTADGQTCSKEANICCKDSKDPKKALKNKAGKFMKGDRRMSDPGERAKMRRGFGENPMFKGITLSDDQQAQLKALREKQFGAEKNVKEAAKADKKAMKAKSRDEMQKLRADFDKEIEKILDKDQIKQYNANKAEMEQMRSKKSK